MTTYLITRTSHWGTPDDEDEERRAPPVPEAFAITRPHWDTRTFKSEAEHDARMNEKWRARGTDHEQLEGGITRRLEDRRVWAVEAESIEELFRRYGTLVIDYEMFGHPKRGQEMLSVEVYDGYRE